MLSVVLPAYNEELLISAAVSVISGVLEGAGIPFELLFVDDGSTDGTWAAVTRAASADRRVRGVRLSRNFGKDAAMFAGLEAAGGDCCAVMDCDLQHPPEKLPEMYRLWEQGYQVVEGVKEDRGRETGLHRFAAQSFYSLLSRAAGLEMSAASDYKLLDRQVVDALNRMPERSVFFRALSYWVGFKRAQVPYRVRERTVGRSKWSVRSLIRYAVTNIGSFSSVPLQAVTFLGLGMLAVSLVFGATALAQKLLGRALGGFTTVILLLLFSSSLIMTSLGILGYYIARIYDEIKGRPRYIVAGRCGGEEETP